MQLIIGLFLIFLIVGGIIGLLFICIKDLYNLFFKKKPPF